MPPPHVPRGSGLLAAFTFAVAPLGAQERISQTPLDAAQVLPGVYRVSEPMGSLLIVLGGEGPLIVGRQSPSLVAKARAILSTLNAPRVRYVLITMEDSAVRWGAGEWQRDRPTIIAQENLRLRMQSVPDSVEIPGGVPTLGFSHVLQMKTNDDEIHVVYQPAAYTNADVSVHFEERRFLYLGNLFVQDGFPAIEVRRGGSIRGLIAAVDKFLAMFGERPELIEPIVPARGPLGTVRDLRDYRDMLVTVRDKVDPMVRRGASLTEVIASRPAEGVPARWRHGVVTEERFVTMVYESLVKDREAGQKAP